MPSLKTVRLNIHGRVQGVGYRQWTMAAAQALTLTGWVRNRQAGHVEILATGPASIVDLFVEQCRKGPPAAIVTIVNCQEESSTTPHDGFDIWPTL